MKRRGLRRREETRAGPIRRRAPESRKLSRSRRGVADTCPGQGRPPQECSCRANSHPEVWMLTPVGSQVRRGSGLQRGLAVVAAAAGALLLTAVTAVAQPLNGEIRGLLDRAKLGTSKVGISVI